MHIDDEDELDRLAAVEQLALTPEEHLRLAANLSTSTNTRRDGPEQKRVAVAALHLQFATAKFLRQLCTGQQQTARL